MPQPCRQAHRAARLSDAWHTQLSPATHLHILSAKTAAHGRLYQGAGGPAACCLESSKLSTCPPAAQPGPPPHETTRDIPGSRLLEDVSARAAVVHIHSCPSPLPSLSIFQIPSSSPTLLSLHRSITPSILHRSCLGQNFHHRPLHPSSIQRRRPLLTHCAARPRPSPLARRHALCLVNLP